MKNALSYVAPGVPTDLQLPATGEEILRCLTQLDELPAQSVSVGGHADHGVQRRIKFGLVADADTSAIDSRLLAADAHSLHAHPHGFVERLAELSRSGVPFVCVTMVEAVGSTPQDAGSKMLVTAEGLVTGTVGGGRVEHKAIEHAQRHAAAQVQEQETSRGPARPRAPSPAVEWNLKRDVGMTCGGTVKLFFETYNHSDWRIVVFGAGHVASCRRRIASASSIATSRASIRALNGSTASPSARGCEKSAATSRARSSPSCRPTRLSCA